jgi:hypothetical protein
MVACVHVARILPGKKDDFVQRIKDGFGANPQALRALGFQRITSFTTAELGDELLVTVYEVDDPSVLERFYSLQPVVDQEEQAHGVLVAPHDHDLVPRNAAFLDVRTET